MLRSFLPQKLSLLALNITDFSEFYIPASRHDHIPGYFRRITPLIDGLSNVGDLEDEVNNFVVLSSESLTSSELVSEINIKIRVQFILSLIKVLLKYKIEPVEPGARSLIQVLLEKSIHYIQKRRPQPPEGWTKKPVGCRDYGCDCSELNRFLTSSDTQSWQFQANGSRRLHIERYLRDEYCELQTIEGDTGMAHILIVSKTTKEYDVRFGRWRNEVDDLKSAIEPFKGPALEKLLGDRYMDLVLLEHMQKDVESSTAVTAPQEPLTITSQQTLNRGPPAPIAGVKRKLEVELIDLTM